MKPDREGESDSNTEWRWSKRGASDGERARVNRYYDALRPQDLQSERLKPTKRGLTETGHARIKFSQCFSLLQSCQSISSSSYVFQSSQMDFQSWIFPLFSHPCVKTSFSVYSAFLCSYFALFLLQTFPAACCRSHSVGNFHNKHT